MIKSKLDSILFYFKVFFLTILPLFMPRFLLIRYWLILSFVRHLKMNREYIKRISLFRKDKFNSLYLLNMTDGNFLIQDICRINRFVGGKNHAIDRLYNQYIRSDIRIDPNEKNSEPENIIDIGANIGEFTIAAANKFEKSIIYAFEPDPLAFECLKFNITSSNLNSRVIALNCALSDNTGQSIFYVSSADADSSLVKPEKFTATIDISCLRGDEIMQQYNITSCLLLKMDAEGFEPEILEGFGDQIKKIDYFAIDVSPERKGIDTEKEVTLFFNNLGAFVKIFRDNGRRKFINSHWVLV